MNDNSQPRAPAVRSTGDVRAVLRQWAAAHNLQELGALSTLYADKAEVLQTRYGTASLGPEAAFEAFNRLFCDFPDNYAEPESIVILGDWAVLDWYGGWRGGMGPEHRALNGKIYPQKGSAFFKVVEGKIVKQFGYLDDLLLHSIKAPERPSARQRGPSRT